MIHTSIDWKSVRRELARERAELFELFVKNPDNVRLAIAISRLDDQISNCGEHIQRARNHLGGAFHLLT
jgi:hypothetical protein